MRPLDELRQLRRALRELKKADAAAEESARFELTQSTRHFSRKAQETLESTMALSAMLIRAGEVDEAHMLIDQVEREVREEEAALRETMNEVQVDRHERQQKIAKLKLTRLFAGLITGASLMVLSIGGIAVASMFLHRNDPSPAHRARVAAEHRQIHNRKQVKIAGVSVKLTAHQLATYKHLSAGSSVASSEMRDLLTAVLPQVPVSMVNRVQTAIVAAVGPVEVPAAVQQLTTAADKVVKLPKHRKARQEPSPEPSPSDDQEPSPSPSSSSDEGSPSSDDGSSSGDDGTTSGQDGGSPVQIPGDGAPHI
ncbi:MAG: hypothetical protein QOH90_633 [Actinomycetota bacterium]|nr:hypothetical protein [Actinomycetota bacterium]